MLSTHQWAAKTLVLAATLLLPFAATAQQPNGPTASLVINGAFAGPPYPIAVGGVPGGVTTVLITGGPAAANAPFALAFGPVSAGFATTPQGIFDLDATSNKFGLAFNRL